MSKSGAPALYGLNLPVSWGNLAEQRRITSAERRAASESRRRRSAAKKNAAARKIQSTFRKMRALPGRRSPGTRRASLEKAKRVGRATRRKLAAPTRNRGSGWIYEDRKALVKPVEGQMRWKATAATANRAVENVIPDESTFEIWTGEGAAGRWVPAIDPMGNYGGPFVNARPLVNNPRYQAHMAEQAAALREAQEAAMRAAAAAEGGIPMEARQRIAARIGKASQAKAKADNPGLTKAQLKPFYDDAYAEAMDAMADPTMPLEAALAAAANVEAAVGIAGPSAREARRALKADGKGPA